MIDWNNPTARAHLAERVGPDEYNRLHRAQIEATTIARVNGYGIRPVNSRFGRLFQVLGTNVAFSSREQAEAHALTLAPKAAAQAE